MRSRIVVDKSVPELLDPPGIGWQAIDNVIQSKALNLRSTVIEGLQRATARHCHFDGISPNRIHNTLTYRRGPLTVSLMVGLWQSARHQDSIAHCQAMRGNACTSRSPGLRPCSLPRSAGRAAKTTSASESCASRVDTLL
eukprot:scaffold5939_cov165-Ochromonas_danica.AAC.4